MEYAASTEAIMEVHSRSHKIRKIGLTLVFVFCLVLLITCIVLAVLYSRELNKSPTNSQEAEKYEICDDEQCFNLGLELVKNMNKSVDPCEDFHAYACGGWESRHPLEDNATLAITSPSIVSNENSNVLKKALEYAHLNYSKNDAVMKMVRVYDSCMNTTAVDALGLQPLKDLIEEYGGWSISQNYNPNVTVAQRIGRAARELNIDSLFGMDVRPFFLNSDVNVLMLKGLATGLNKRDYLDQDEDSEKKRKEYKNYMKAVSQIFNVSYTKMKAIYDFEVKLAKISSGKDPDAELMEYIKSIAISARIRRSTEDWTITLSRLSRVTGFPWPVLIEVLDILFDRRLTGNEKVLSLPAHIVLFKAIGLLYRKTNHALLADYIMWQVVRHYVGGLPNQYRPPKGDFLISTNIPRWKQCIYAMLIPFDMPLGLLFVDVHFNDDAKVKIREMIENTRTSFIRKLPTQTWMDKITQEKAKEKALAIAIEEIGYPAYIKDPVKLKAQYDSLKVTDSLMDNMKAANHLLRMRTLKNFERPVDKKEWTFASPAKYNAFYAPFLNRIIFLAGILQKPMYSPGYPSYLNHGGIGMVIGHEITHGFDGTGRLFDKKGNYNNWWSASSAAAFVSKAKCFVKQYNKYRIFDKYANGTMTLNENIADNGGIKLAYDAYQRWTKENGTEKILPGLDLNPNQLFFLGFAQSWCSVYTKEGAYTQLDTDNHSNEKYRILGPLSNFERFSEVFKCKPNSGMNPVDRCTIW
ncbi:endothelin-converting enzyme 1-like isoform X2 [Actinia tenebrosa]|uniref:Endothelin-converting enzyme 1-like isoform X2 n=1 Tax=Actinia tenebrosa TaxID=6105 RepID=A0A6P8IRK7_ACTTE|nr:endothelin-converting enzyme 1-like isoform X2 [Actinia tenebrosa]